MATPVVHIDCSQDLQFEVDVTPPDVGRWGISAQFLVVVGAAVQRHNLPTGQNNQTFKVSQSLLAIPGMARQLKVSVVDENRVRVSKDIEITFRQDPLPKVNCGETNVLTEKRIGMESTVTVRLRCEPCP
jgi:hypothetical protein